ncbi:MAG TPA: hypothetical protein VMW58_00380 [Anaerolineae bacterium]|nr:hypothetical protein [Anaerolineae bacterium]
MKPRKIVAPTVILGVLVVLAGGVGLALAQGPPLGASVGTAFTYQGQLTDDDDPATGTYDFEFELHDHPTEDSQVGGTVYVDDKLVSDGLFTVLLDFGSSAFNGEARHLEIGVRPGDSGGDYTTLAPRQELTAAPYALHSLSTGSLQGHPVSDTVPTTGQLLQWNGSAWEPATVASTNQPPVAILQADPAVLMPGETTTTLSLSLSYDPEGGPLTYAFDPTGQTLGEPASYGSTAVTAAQYSAPGDYLAAGWVKDGAGAFDVARALVSVYRFWTTVVESPGNGGTHLSLAVVDGRPAIAYYGTNADLKYVWAGDATGSSWRTPVTADSSGNLGEYASLAVVDGHPAIAYYDYSPNYDLKYVRASDATGSSWGMPLTVDSGGWVGEYASLAVVDGHPAIAYYDDGASYDLKYVRATDATGSSWGTPLTVDSTGTVGWYASLAVVENRPAIAYYDAGSDNLKYVWASDATGSSWGSPLTVDSAGDVGAYASLAVVDGRPAIAYFDNSNDDLKYVRASDATGSSWGTPLTVDSGGLVGKYASLAVVENRPAIAYFDDTNDALKYVRANDTTGSSWGTPITVEGSGYVGTYASLAVVEDRPAIAYYDASNYDLRYTIPRQE